MWVWYDGIFCQQPCLYTNNRAFQYGDGLFETIMGNGPMLWFIEEHWRRLKAGLQLIDMQLPAYVPDEPIELKAFIGRVAAELLTKNQIYTAYWRMKWMVWRQPGGLYAASQSGCEMLMMIQGVSGLRWFEPVRVGIYEGYQLHQHAASAIKNLYALPYMLAARWAKHMGYEDALLLDTNGYLSEASSANLFWLKGNTWFTPSLATGCVAGVARARWMAEAQAMGFAIEECCAKPKVLQSAEGVWLTNVAGIRQVVAVDGLALKQSALARQHALAIAHRVWHA